MLPMSPGGGYNGQYCSAMDQTGMFGGQPVGQPMFPSMSVNVSMNIPMHTYSAGASADGLHSQIGCSQVGLGDFLF